MKHKPAVCYADKLKLEDNDGVTDEIKFDLATLSIVTGDNKKMLNTLNCVNFINS